MQLAKARKYWDIIRYKARADLASDSLKTWAGILWWILDPVLMMLVFYVVFSVLRQRGDDFVQFLLIGLVIWQWFAGSVTNGGNSIVQAKGLIKQIYLPKEIFPLVGILTDGFKFTIVFVLLLVFLWISGFPATSLYLWLPFLMLAQLMLIIGVVFATSALVPFAPDIMFVVRHTIRLMFFLSGIFFTADQIPEQYLKYYYANPMANLIEGYRDVLMYGRVPDADRLILISVTSFAVFLLGWWMIRHFDRTYPKIIN